MKLLFTKALLAFSLAAGAQITIPNAGFESWSPATGTNTLMPDGWKSISSFPGIHRSTNAHAGTYALKVGVAQYFTGVGGADMTYNFSFPQVSAPPTAYSFWAKVHINGSDKVHVTASLMKSPSSTNVAAVNYNLDALTSSDNNTTVWTLHTYTLITNGQTPVDSAYLRFQAYPANDTASYVLIDDLSFSGVAQGIHEQGETAVIESSYPNPAGETHHLIYSLNNGAEVSLIIYDLLGNKISTVFAQNQNKGTYKADVDVSGLPSGIYQAMLSVNGKSYSKKIAVVH